MYHGTNPHLDNRLTGTDRYIGAALDVPYGKHPDYANSFHAGSMTSRNLV